MPSKTLPPPVKKTCFIVGPIGEADSAIRRLADWLLHGVIKPVLESDEFGYAVKRADEDADPGSITSAVITDLTTSDLVIADLTGFNPNAFYELGVRHALRKPVIHMIAEPIKLPFDNADQRTIFVDFSDFHNVARAKARLELAVRAVNAEGYQVTNPVVQAGAIMELRDSADPKDQLIASLEERLVKIERGNEGTDSSIAKAKQRDAIKLLSVLSEYSDPKFRASNPHLYYDSVLAAKLSLLGFEGLNPIERSEVANAIAGVTAKGIGLKAGNIRDSDSDLAKRRNDKNDSDTE